MIVIQPNASTNDVANHRCLVIRICQEHLEDDRALADLFAEIIDPTGSSAILDLCDVTSCDSGMVSRLLAIRSRLMAIGCRAVCLLNVPDQLSDILGVLGAHALFADAA